MRNHPRPPEVIYPIVIQSTFCATFISGDIFFLLLILIIIIIIITIVIIIIIIIIISPAVGHSGRWEATDGAVGQKPASCRILIPLYIATNPQILQNIRTQFGLKMEGSFWFEWIEGIGLQTAPEESFGCIFWCRCIISRAPRWLKFLFFPCLYSLSYELLLLN